MRFENCICYNIAQQFDFPRVMKQDAVDKAHCKFQRVKFTPIEGKSYSLRGSRSFWGRNYPIFRVIITPINEIWCKNCRRVKFTRLTGVNSIFLWVKSFWGNIYSVGISHNVSKWRRVLINSQLCLHCNC